MIKAGIVGATGYAGLELVRILSGHPEAELSVLSSVSFEGKRLSDVYPALLHVRDEELSSSDGIEDSCDVVFASLPHGLSQPIAARCAAKGRLFIDLGADFRLESESEYEKWYNGSFDDKELHKSAVYGLCELSRKKIKGAGIIANPGCYPTSAALGLWPALSLGLCGAEGIIIDAKSGVTGAGRALTQNTHYPELNEGFSPYKAGAHRHTPEIEQTLSKMAGTDVKVTFVPHLLPVNRGILSTMYLQKGGRALSDIHAAYRDFYKGELFVRVLENGRYADLKNVRMSNYCDISLHEDPHTGTLIVVSAIDNMVKGAAGQAVQNMNIALGFDEAAGLQMIPPAF